MKYTGITLIFFTVLFSACRQKHITPMYSIIPEPVFVEKGKGFFHYNDRTSILFAVDNDSLNKIVKDFADNIYNHFGVIPGTDIDNPLPNTIKIKLDNTLDLPDEGYMLRIRKLKIDLQAPSYTGIFYGLQTLTQLIHLNAPQRRKILLPVMQIKDYPRFEWRGMLLDVCRHFMPVEDVKKYIDYMALYKYNKFHWHLTDDQGWRIEIKQYPLLTEVGAWREETLIGHNREKPRKYDGKMHGGFYTHEEILEIVQYASDRFIEVIPEIEMPGHARAAIASYPWLGVTGEKVEVKKEWGISPYIYMPSDETFTFIKNVLREVMALFPSEYFHIGGDEARKDQWEESEEVQELIRELGLQDEKELQSWFIHRIGAFLNENGKKLIGWDEILEGGLAPNATVMSWRGEEGGIKAAKMGHDVVMTPTSHCYFDYYQAKPIENEPLAIGGYLPIDTVYSYDPVPENLNEKESKHILGAQANVWTEYIPDFEQVEYMIFPRMLAMSEITWTPQEKKQRKDFMQRVMDHEKIFKTLGVDYSHSGMPKVE